MPTEQPYPEFEENDALRSDPEIVMPYFEMPEYQCPTMTIGIESLYGLGPAVGSLLAGISINRQKNEGDEALAERASQAIKELILEELKDHEADRLEIERLEFEKQRAKN